jgi:hypothetical protein
VAARAIARLQDLPGPLRLPIALPDRDQQAGDVTNHVMQERIGRDLDGEPVPLAFDGKSGQAADRNALKSWLPTRAAVAAFMRS